MKIEFQLEQKDSLYFICIRDARYRFYIRYIRENTKTRPFVKHRQQIVVKRRRDIYAFSRAVRNWNVFDLQAGFPLSSRDTNVYILIRSKSFSKVSGRCVGQEDRPDPDDEREREGETLARALLKTTEAEVFCLRCVFKWREMLYGRTTYSNR